MKKLFIFLFLFFFLLQSKAYAQSGDQKNISPTNAPNIDYVLSFPGILPDSPFYFMKVIRDKITIYRTNDPLKRIDFYLLQTDKQLLASAILVDKKNIELAKKTALKAENNYTLINEEIKKNKLKLGQDRVDKLIKADFKHQQVLNSLIKRVDKKDQETFKQVLYFSKVNLEELKKNIKDKI